MKKRIAREQMGQSVFCLQPSRPILCTTRNADGTDHAAPFGWCVPASQTPPMLVLAIQYAPRKSHSLENIQRSGEFVVNLPDMNLIDPLVLSSYDTRLGENKMDRSGFTRLPSCEVAPCGIAECRAHLECRVREITYPGDHAVIAAEIVCARYDEDAFYGDMLINTRTFQPVIHIQNFTAKDKSAQYHVFLNGNGVVVNEVPFPEGDRNHNQ